MDGCRYREMGVHALIIFGCLSRCCQVPVWAKNLSIERTAIPVCRLGVNWFVSLAQRQQETNFRDSLRSRESGRLSRPILKTKCPDVPILNLLMDMYAKCGAIDYCKRVFGNMHCKDLTSWNTVLTGYVVTGTGGRTHMVESGIRPDGVTFIALLSGCSHAGLTDQGRRLFDKMKLGYGISPTVEHYACLVDLLGRAGRIEEALDVVENMPVKPSGSIWGSLLNSCRLQGKVALAERAAMELFELEPNNPGNYVVLSNVYAKWRDVGGGGGGGGGQAGCSWLQIGSRIHTFVVGGGFSVEFKKVWNELTDAMEEVGYIPDTSVVLHD
ncbi:putative pentatricopeptide [Rosa chinensis]|uniref:Putative pentatricopeptide n=1 Tax=Rosa chinensis TaxID=74649 RepID=A0A2P6RGJ4_ROSCH|nr:putative pentatricopeptide [Rosa chinensis]